MYKNNKYKCLLPPSLCVTTVPAPDRDVLMTACLVSEERLLCRTPRNPSRMSPVEWERTMVEISEHLLELLEGSQRTGVD